MPRIGWSMASAWAARSGAATTLPVETLQDLVFEREHGRQATGVDEHDRALGAKLAAASVVDKTSHRLGGVDRVKDETLQARRDAHRLQTAGARFTIGGFDVIVVAFDNWFVE